MGALRSRRTIASDFPNWLAEKRIVYTLKTTLNMKAPLLLLSLLTACVWADETPAFVPLFAQEGAPNGFLVRHWADVSKPAGGNATWEVKDGVLRSTGDRGCWLISEKKYGDFELEYEFKLGPRGNSGLALRAPLQGDPAFDGMELQMADFRYNEQAKDSELTGGLYRVLAPMKQVYKPEEWNKMRVKLVGSTIRVELNDVVIQDTDLANQTTEVTRHDGKGAPALKDRPREGHLGFQELSRENGRVMIRGARIREFAK